MNLAGWITLAISIGSLFTTIVSYIVLTKHKADILSEDEKTLKTEFKEAIDRLNKISSLMEATFARQSLVNEFTEAGIKALASKSEKFELCISQITQEIALINQILELKGFTNK